MTSFEQAVEGNIFEQKGLNLHGKDGPCHFRHFLINHEPIRAALKSEGHICACLRSVSNYLF